jgi:ribonucleoside-diphosphate reductase alpha chain
LDNVIDANRYPLPEIEERTKGNRKIGLGVMGFADMLIKMGIPYDTEEGIELGEEVMEFIHKEAQKASVELAKERGVFPNFKGSLYDRPRGPRVRNATLTTIAPTGTISIIAGCSSGVEPIFALAFIRNVMDNTELPEAHPALERVLKQRGLYSEDLMKSIATVGGLHEMDVPDDLKKVFVTAHDVSPEWHIRMQAAYQDHVDNAVSKTVNFSNQARPEDVERVYLLAYELGVKGVTIYRDGSRQEQVLNIGEVKRKGGDGAATQMELGPQGTAVMPVRPSRSPVLRGETREKVTGCGSLYVTVNEDDYGPREIFANMGKAGGCASASTEAIGRLISLAFRYGVPPDKIVKQLRGIRCHVPLGFGPNQILSCPDAIGKALADKYHLAGGNGAKAVGQLEMPIAYAQGACPDCGGAIEHEGGCMVCRACGYSKCS